MPARPATAADTVNSISFYYTCEINAGGWGVGAGVQVGGGRGGWRKGGWGARGNFSTPGDTWNGKVSRAAPGGSWGGESCDPLTQASVRGLLAPKSKLERSGVLCEVRRVDFGDLARTLLFVFLLTAASNKGYR